MSFGLFNKVAAVVIGAATAVWGWDQVPPPATWDLSNIELPQIHLPDVKLSDFKLPEIKFPDIKLPKITLPDRSAANQESEAPSQGKVAAASPPGTPPGALRNAAAPRPKPDAVAETVAATPGKDAGAAPARDTAVAAAPEATVAAPAAPVPEAEAPAPRVSTPLSARLSGDHTRDRLAGVVDWSSLRGFYGARAFAPVWTGGDDAAARADIALGVLQQAAGQGLNPEDYFVGARTLDHNPPPPALAIDFEVLLTDAVLRYAHDVRVGRVRTNPADPDMAFVPQSYDAAHGLAGALGRGDLSGFFAGLPPRYPQYQLLVAALAKSRADLHETPSLPRIPSDPAIDLTSEDPRLVLLRQRLAAEDGNISPVAPSSGGSDGLRGAVMRFQERNGLPPDGFVGPDTLEMLNARPADRVRQIAANMERWRWLPHEMDPRAIFVQVPEAMIRYVEDGRVVMTSKAIFGRPTNPSPSMGVKVVALTVNPPWHAPESITVNELLPALRNDRNFLHDQNMVLIGGPPGDPYGYSVNWNSVSANGFPYAIQQRAGRESALGRVKFEMPNNYIVYLHDTPDHYFFGLPNHALSHGCIRVDRPLDLAALLLGGDESAARAKLDAMVAAGATQRVELPRPVPVYILYLTALANDGGSVRFYPDLYKRDPPLEAALRSTEGDLVPGL